MSLLVRLFILWFQYDFFFKGIDWPGVKHKLFVTDHLPFQLIRFGQNYVHFGDTLWWLVMRFIPRHFAPKTNSLLVHVLIFLLVSIPIITNTIWKKKCRFTICGLISICCLPKWLNVWKGYRYQFYSEFRNGNKQQVVRKNHDYQLPYSYNRAKERRNLDRACVYIVRHEPHNMNFACLV